MKQRGISMIEILVTLTIVAFALLGLLGLQARALSFQKDSFDRKAAAELVSNLGERMRANHTGFMDSNYDDDFEAATATPGGVTACSPCTSAQLATLDIDQWRIDLRRRIAGGASYVEPVPAFNPTWALVTVAWPEPQAAPGPGQDAVCDAMNEAGATIPANYRCYQTRIFP